MLARKMMAAATFFADGGNSPADVDPTTGHGPEWGKAGPVGLLTIVLLCVGLYFLVKSLNRNLKKVPESFDAPKVPVIAGVAPPATGSATAVAGPAAAGSAAPPSAPDVSSDGSTVGADPRPAAE